MRRRFPRSVPVGAHDEVEVQATASEKMQRRAVRRRFDPPDGRVAAVQTVRDAPPKALVEMSPVEQRETPLGVAQPSLLAGPGCTGDEPGELGPTGGERPVDQAVRHHVLPSGRRRNDPGTPAHQVGLGTLEDGHVVAGPMQERRCRTFGDRSPIMPTLMAVAPEPRGAPPGR